ncbi:hypothetical protein [Marivita sp.]|uniref:hypothetical protein n=1 Tax=Marivita sp. TaxID=2003365 RepID=UPI003F724D5B
MPLIQPNMPPLGIQISRKPDATDVAKTLVVSVPEMPLPVLSSHFDDQSIKPAAPPTAVQMQIKALINEQALTLEAAKQDIPGNPT